MKHLKLPDTAWVGAAEAAFIAAVDQKELNRVIDENALPTIFVLHREGSREFTRLGAALVRFYFDTAKSLTKTARIAVCERVAERLEARDDAPEVFGLAGPVRSFDWSFDLDHVRVDLSTPVFSAVERSARARRAAELIVEDPDTLGGLPTFKGTRVPIDVLPDSEIAPHQWERLKRAYPVLTEELVEAAKIYSQIRPRRGRPPRSDTLAKNWKLIRSVRVPAKRA